MKIPFLNLARQHEQLMGELLPIVESTLTSSRFVLGPNVTTLEAEIARLSGAQFGVGVNSGTDALFLSLAALGIGPGDEVITTPFSFIAPPEVIFDLGATIVFADIDPQTLNIDPLEIEKRITSKTRAVIPVHLFGQAAPMDRIIEICRPQGIDVVEDCAQAIGATQDAHPVGSFGTMGCFSFYPTKNLGAAGDAGMVVTRDEALDRKLRLLRGHGVGRRYHHDEHGYNSRLDELQAAILLSKLKRLQSWNERRREIAERYSSGLADLPLTLPTVAAGNTHVYHVYHIQTPQRDALQAHLSQAQIDTLIYYPLPLHLQKVYANLGFREGDFPNAEATTKSILPLPMYPELTDEEVDYVVDCIRNFSF